MIKKGCVCSCEFNPMNLQLLAKYNVYKYPVELQLIIMKKEGPFSHTAYMSKSTEHLTFAWLFFEVIYCYY